MQIILVQTSGGEELKLGAKKSFCTYHEHETRGVDCVELESTQKGEEKLIRLKEFWSKRLFHSETGGHVLTRIWTRVHLLDKRPMENGLALDQRRKKSLLGLWARRRRRSRWSFGRCWWMKVASYHLDFVLFQLGKFNYLVFLKL